MAEPTMADLTLASAHRDAAAYSALVDNAGIHDAILGFHAQQVVEKAIKAVLFKHGVMVPRTHNIAQLLVVLGDAQISVPPYADTLDALNPYAVTARYGALDAGDLDRTLTAAWVKGVLDWARLSTSSTGSP